MSKVVIPTAANSQVVDIPMDDIYSDADFNCRGRIGPADCIDLARNIKANGLLQPIVIQPYNKIPGKKYRIVIGHRRHMAFLINESKTIPCIIKENLNDINAHAMNLIENLKRSNLNLLQEARSIQPFLNVGMTPDEISKKLGISKGWTLIRMTLLKLPPEIQQEAAAGFITQEQVKQIDKIPTKAGQFEAVKMIKESRFRGEKLNLAPKKKPTTKNLLKRKPRDKAEVTRMLEHILDTLGPGFHTRCLAWASGEISDLDLYRSAKEYGIENGRKYIPPPEAEVFMDATADIAAVRNKYA